MTFARRLAPHVIAAMTSPRTRDARRWWVERRRRLRREPHRVHYFHQVDDPYSQLSAQVLAEVAARYDVVLMPHLVGPPPDAAAPDRERLVGFARRDAADIGPGYGLAFPAVDAQPAPALVIFATRILANADAAAFLRLAPEVGAALWRGDRTALDALATAHGARDTAAASFALASGNRLRERLGHYLGATFYYGGEWYWGVDRLHDLEERLRALGAARPGADARLVAPRPAARALAPPASGAGEGAHVTLEFYPSLRSPYSYIAMERVFALTERTRATLVLRPVLPMVMRGLAVPRPKQLYITLDTKREAEDAGVPFGRVCDPVGRPVERGFSLWPLACARGCAGPYLHSFTRAAFAEGVDTGTDAGLRLVAERAGLDWREAREQLGREGWRDELEANRKQLLALGLWGVPSFRVMGGGLPDYATWGQDRLWRVEEEIRRRIA